MKSIVSFFLMLAAFPSFAQSWVEVQKVVAPDRDAYDHLGNAVAINNNYAIVGAYQDGEDVQGNNPIAASGSAYIYEKDGNGVWNQVQKITASDRDFTALFGYSVAIDGDFIVVGAYKEAEDVLDQNTMSRAGAAYVFKRDAGGTWNQVQKIVASDRAMNNEFGWSVAIAGDYIAVGAHLDERDLQGNNLLQYSGSIYIYEQDGNGQWNEVQKMVASDRSFRGWYGNALAMSGTRILVGAPGESNDASGINYVEHAGAAYVIERDSLGTWVEVEKVVASNRVQLDWFGNAVALSGDYAMMGELSQNDSSYIFERDLMGNWQEVKKCPGIAVAIHGTNAITGEYAEDLDANGGDPMTFAGAAYLYERDPFSNAWVQTQKIVASDRTNADRFGESVAITNGAVLVGAPFEDHDLMGGAPLNNSGAAYFFHQSPVSIVEDELAAALQLYPNPTRGEVTLEIADQYFNEPVSISVYNSTGQLVLQKAYAPGMPIRFELTNVGLFLVQVQSGKIITALSVIKQ